MLFILATALGTLAFQLASGCVAAALKTEKFFDLCGALNFVAIAAYGAADADNDWRMIFVSAMYAVWAIRLGAFLFARVIKNGEDERFRDVKTRPVRFLVLWLIQAVWVIVTTLPLTLLGDAPARRGTDTFPDTAWDAVGLVLFVIGLLFEVVADWQKWVFKADPANEGLFISEGLWQFSRHPNYFGEIVLQFAIFTAAASGLDGGYVAAAALSPSFVAFLLIFVSGIPQLEERRKDDKHYQSYAAATSVLIPWPPSHDWRTRIIRSDS